MAASCYSIVEVAMAMVYPLQDTENTGKTGCYNLLFAYLWVVRNWLLAVFQPASLYFRHPE